MSFLHLLYIGYFERDGEWVRMEMPPGELRGPVVRYPLNLDVVSRLASAFGPPGDDGLVPPSWHFWIEDGYLACDRYSLGPDEIAFLKRLVGETGCQIADGPVAVSVDVLAPKEQAARVGEVSP